MNKGTAYAIKSFILNPYDIAANKKILLASPNIT